MRNLKKFLAVVSVVTILGASTAVFALDVKSPAEIVSGLTGKTVEDVAKERANGKTYGTVAKDAGKLDEFKAQILEQKKAILDQRVKDGNITQEQADKAYNAMKSNQSTCDGIGQGAMGKKGGGQCGGMGMRNGNGIGSGCTLN